MITIWPSAGRAAGANSRTVLVSADRKGAQAVLGSASSPLDDEVLAVRLGLLVALPAGLTTTTGTPTETAAAKTR